jgi:hypothetical protein
MSQVDVPIEGQLLTIRIPNDGLTSPMNVAEAVCSSPQLKLESVNIFANICVPQVICRSFWMRLYHKMHST